MEQMMLTTKEFSDKYGVPLPTVYNWCRTGKLTTVKERWRWMIPDGQGKPVKNALGPWEFSRDDGSMDERPAEEDSTFTSWTVYVSKLDHAAFLKCVLSKAVMPECYVYSDNGCQPWRYGFGIAVPTTIAKKVNDRIKKYLSTGEIPHVSSYEDDEVSNRDSSFVVERFRYDDPSTRSIRCTAPTREEALEYCKENGYYDNLVNLFEDDTQVEYVYEIREVPFNLPYAKFVKPE